MITAIKNMDCPLRSWWPFKVISRSFINRPRCWTRNREHSAMSTDLAVMLPERHFVYLSQGLLQTEKDNCCNLGTTFNQSEIVEICLCLHYPLANRTDILLPRLALKIWVHCQFRTNLSFFFLSSSWRMHYAAAAVEWPQKCGIHALPWWGGQWPHPEICVWK